MKSTSLTDLNALCDDLRRQIILASTTSGGHLASNLGVVELAVALHHVFDVNQDKLVWDVGHQCYAHKLLSGRSLEGLRTNQGVTGFPNHNESSADVMTMGHSSTSLSVALGLARARDLAGQNHNIVAIIGDGALGGGQAFEALNDIGRTRMLIILNDNEMSISHSRGGLAKHLTRLRLSRSYVKIKRELRRGVAGLPLVGKPIEKLMLKLRSAAKDVFLSDKMFENMGIKYYGPLDGHDVAALIRILRDVKSYERPVLVHIITKKGKGYAPAETDPIAYHGLAAGQQKSNDFGQTLGQTLTQLANADPRVVGITAAMPSGTGLDIMQASHPDRVFDVGIAEQHAVSLAAGLATGGARPFVAIYSSFLQRGYDQIIHDIAINQLPVTLCIDRAGVIGADGVTHQGLYDICYLSMIPGMTIMAPADGEELADMLRWSLTQRIPLAIRYPRNYQAIRAPHAPISLGRWEFKRATEQGRAVILAVGNRMLDIAHQTPFDVCNARFVKPLDEQMLAKMCTKYHTIVTLEDGMLHGGFGASVRDFCQGRGVRVLTFGFGDQMVTNLDAAECLRMAGITPDRIVEQVSK